MSMGRSLAMLSLLAVGAVLMAATAGLPDFGDPQAPAARHLSSRMLEGAYHDAHTPNVVTVMIADYRSFDTLGEGIVVFTAGLACFLLLRSERRREEEDPDA
jgi:multicomponent Na+:H+ antiporter subunit B